VIVRYLYVVSVSAPPSKADAPLIVDPNAVLSCAISFELFKSVSWRKPQVFQPFGCVQYEQLLKCTSMQPWWQSTNVFALEQPLSIAIAKALDHERNVTLRVNNGKRYYHRAPVRWLTTLRISCRRVHVGSDNLSIIYDVAMRSYQLLRPRLPASFAC